MSRHHAPDDFDAPTGVTVRRTRVSDAAAYARRIHADVYRAVLA